MNVEREGKNKSKEYKNSSNTILRKTSSGWPLHDEVPKSEILTISIKTCSTLIRWKRRTFQRANLIVPNRVSVTWWIRAIVLLSGKSSSISSTFVRLYSSSPFCPSSWTLKNCSRLDKKQTQAWRGRKHREIGWWFKSHLGAISNSALAKHELQTHKFVLRNHR